MSTASGIFYGTTAVLTTTSTAKDSSQGANRNAI